ncbi:DUF3100 domain-containing protein [Terrilactibacillus laevilacticus]|uniref:DUF3100 domain-containing protein n=1 Tax=Terrilactibacillus laevilacticus TaxID=1380157 RepID=UPI001FE37051|nr:DUF3100 domain-containing protein [Terrilactibacillus laevilacticus]
MSAKPSMFSWKVHLFVLILVCVSELIGVHELGLGIGTITLFPMLYALIIGSIMSIPKLKILKKKEMQISANILGISFMLFIAKLGTMMGPQLMELFKSGIPLLLQEAGHILGTIILGLPIALLIGMKRETIGATFSIDREPNLAIISEKYRSDSPEGRGALGVYVCGTLFGALYLSLLTSVIAKLDIFHPLSLAMGAGVGSGSMMAAVTGTLVTIYPEQADTIAVFSGGANLITTLLGTYICVFISLPLTEFLYNKLNPILGRKHRNEIKNIKT